VKAEASNGCTATKTYQLKVKENPTLTGQNMNVCLNNDAKLEIGIEKSNDANITNQEISFEGQTISGTSSFIFDKTSLIATYTHEKVAAKQSLSFVGTNLYRVETSQNVTKDLTCSTTKDFTINTLALPAVSIKNVDAICLGSSVTLEVENPNNSTVYTWTDPAKTETQVTSLTATPSQAGTHKYKVEADNGCIDSAFISVKVDTIPTFTLSGESAICEGNTTTITASNRRLQYDWGVTGNYSVKNVYKSSSISGDITISVKGKDDYCTSKSVDFNITKKENPNLVITADDYVCEGDDITLTVEDKNLQGTTFEWHNDRNNKSNTFTKKDVRDEVSKFTVYGTNNGCKDTTEWTVYKRELPTIAIEGENAYCPESDITLKATGAGVGGHYSWSTAEVGKGNAQYDNNNSNDTYDVSKFSQETTYYVWGKDANGCENNVQKTISVHQRPDFQVLGDTVVCYNGSTTLTAKSTISSVSYTWKTDKDANVFNGNIFKINDITEDVKVTVTAKDGNSCDSVYSFVVRAKAYPTITSKLVDANRVPTFSTAICRGSNITLGIQDIAAASNGSSASIQWLNAAGTPISGATGYTYDATNVNVDNTKYSVKATYSYLQYNEQVQCTSQETFTINTHNLPVIDITGTTNICLNEKTTLTATPGYKSYQWKEGDNNLDTDNVIADLSPTTNTTYFVEVVDNNNCKNSASVSVTVKALPEFTLSTPSNKVCVGNVVTISTNNSTLLYDWSGSGYQSKTSHNVTIEKDTTVTISAIDQGTQCVGTQSIKFSTKPYPVIVLSAPSFICEGDSDIIMNNGATGYQWEWRENDKNGKILSTEESCSTGEMVSDKTIYVAATLNGCTSEQTINVPAAPLPTIKIDNAPEARVCYNSCITIKATGGTTYRWDTDTQYKETASITSCGITTKTVHRVWGKNANGCENHDSITIYVDELPDFDIEAKQRYCEGEIATLSADNDALSYEWSTKSDFSDIVSRSQVFNPTINGDVTYYVRGTSNDGCSNSEPKSVALTMYKYPEIKFLKEPSSVCEGGDAEFEIEVSNGVPSEYEWDGTAGKASYTKTISNVTNITVAAISIEGGCKTEVTKTVGTLSLPTISVEKETVCIGETANLTASSGVQIQNWSWVSGTSGKEVGTDAQFTTPKIYKDSVYTVYGEDNNGCIGRKDVTVTNHPAPVFSINSNSPVCEGGDVVLTADNPSLTYNWGDGIFKSDITFTKPAEENETYTIIGKSMENCTDTLNVNPIVIRKNPNFSVSMTNDLGKKDNHVCLDGDMTMNAKSEDNRTYTYKWGENSEATGNEFKLTDITETTTIPVTAYEYLKNENGVDKYCETKIDITVEVWALPDITVTANPGAICIGNEVTLKAEGTNETEIFVWKKIGKTGETVTVKPNKEGQVSYEVEGTDKNGCKNTGVGEVIVNPLPSLVIDPVAPVCRGTQANISAKGSASHYEWREEGSSEIIGTADFINPTVDPQAGKNSIKYYVLAEDLNSCVKFDSVEVFVKEYPTLTHYSMINGKTAKDSVCRGQQEITVHVEGADTWSWLDETNNTNAFRTLTNLSSEKKLTAYGTSNGCTSEHTITIGIWDVPDFTIDGTTSVCLYDDIILNASANNPSNKYEYTWMGVNNGADFVGDSYKETTQKVESKSFSVKATDKEGCYKMQPYNGVKINPLPTVTILGGDSTICEGTDITREVGGSALDHTWYIANSMQGPWERKLTGDEFTTTVGKTSYIKVEGTDINGCVNRDSITVDIKPFPTLTVKAPEKVCYGTEARIVVSGADSYTWDTQEGVSDSIDANGKRHTIIKEVLTSDRTFTVYGSTASCETAMDITVGIWELPSIAITTTNPNNEICIYDSIQLKGSNGESNSYIWYEKGASKSFATSDNVIVKPTNKTTYVVEGGDANGCRNRAEFDVIVNTLPDVVIDGVASICKEEEITLTAVSQSNIRNYNWKHSGEALSTITAEILQNQTFEVEVEDLNGCKNTATHEVKALAIPTLSSQVPDYVCFGETAEIILNGADKYFNSEEQEIIGGKMNLSPSRDTSFTITGYVGTCAKTLDLNLPVMSKPEIWISANQSAICKGVDQTTLTANGAKTYRWYEDDVKTGNTSASRIVSPSQTTTYKIYGVDEKGCYNWSEDFVLTVNELPSFTVHGEALVCKGDYDTLYVKYDKTLLGQATSFTWMNTGEVKDTITPAINEKTTYVVIGKNDFGCEAQRSITVDKKDYPTLHFKTNVPSICEGEDIVISAITNTNNIVWQDGSTGRDFAIDSILTGKTLTAEVELDGCKTTDQFIVNVNPKPYVWITGDRDVCAYTPMKLTANGAQTYTWNTGKTGSVLSQTIKSGGVYTFDVTGVDANGCSFKSDQFKVTIHNNPIVKVTGDNYVCEGGVATLTATGAETYVWNAGITSTDATVYPIINKTTTFTVTGTDAYGCVGTSNGFEVKKIDYPTLTHNAPTSICKGEELNFNVSGATKYIFEGETINANEFNYSKNLENSTTLNIIGDVNGCQTALPITVEVNQLPTVWISGDASVCKDKSTLLTATGARSYEWFLSKENEKIGNASSYNARPVKTTTYKVIGTDVNNCKGETTHTIKVDSLPKFEISGPDSTCNGNTISLKIVRGDALSYSWNNGAVGDAITPVITGSKSFQVTATGSNGCEATKTHIVKSFPYPQLTVSAPSTVCAKEEIRINMSGADHYNWTIDPENHSGVLLDNPENTTVYHVEGISNNCASKASITVNVLPTPSVTYQGNTSICKGDRMQLVAYGAENYRWNTGLSKDTLSTYPNSTLNYWVIGTDKNGCSTKVEIPVTVNEKPTFELTAEDSICRGYYAEFSATSDKELTYFWGFGSNVADDARSKNEEIVREQIDRSMMVYVTATDVNGCKANVYHHINIKPSPKLSILGDLKVCLGDEVSLTGAVADSDNENKVTYQWIYNTGTEKNDTLDGKNLTFVPRGNTRITLLGTLGACVSEEEVMIESKMKPNVAVLGDNYVCSGQDAILLANGADAYEWILEDNETINGHVITVPSLYKPTTVKVNGYSNEGCSNSTTFTIDVRESPNVWVKLLKVEGCPGETTRINVVAGGASEYSWYSEPKSKEIAGNATNELRDVPIDELTKITVIGVDEAFKCEGTASLYVDTLSHKPIKFSVNPSIILEENPIVNLKAEYPTKDASWTWDAGDNIGTELEGLNVTYNYPNASTQDSFIIQAKVIDEQGCELTADSTIYVWKKFWVPEAFSPNNDGLNDLFRLRGTQFLTSVHIVIYNRVGTVVYESNDINGNWDGKYNYEDCPMGIYGYTIFWESDFRGITKSGTERGHLELIR
jgi:gliding motility-associated-like protein